MPRVGRAPEQRVLVGRFHRLEPLLPDTHLAALYGASHGDPVTEQLWTYMPYGPIADQAAMLAWLQGCAGSKDPLFRAVIDAESGAAVGMVSFLNIDPAMRRLELGHIWYGPRAQRGKANTEAVFLMLSHAFEDLCCRRVEWKCDALNARSRTAALRLGFSFEGLFRQHVIVKGRNRDTAWFAMLDAEWPAVRRNMERWLYGGEEPGPSLRALNASLLRTAPLA